jgi:uncharacterized membrane protein YcaP (DUF421 family)
MLDSIWGFVNAGLGLEVESLSVGQMASRAVITFVVTVVIIRLGDKRLFGKATAFDFIVAIMIGSIMSRAITGSGPLLPIWVAGFVLIGLHWLLATLAFHLDWFGPLVKGNAVRLIADGQIEWSGMREASITRNELEQALRAEGEQPDPATIQSAYLERDGTISVLPRPNQPRILEVIVADGVQTVRIALE